MRQMLSVAVWLSLPAFAMAQFSPRPAPKQVQQNGPRIVQLDDGIKQMASDISKGIKNGTRPKRVAVIPLRDISTETTHLGKHIAVRLSTALFERDRILLVERLYLDKVLNEQKLSESGAIDKTTAQKVGGLAGANVIVTGSHTDLGDHLAVDIVAIDCETGIQLGAAQSNVAWTEALRKLADSTVAVGAPQPAGQAEPPMFKDAHWRIEVVSTELLKDGRLSITVSVANPTNAKDPQYMWMETGPKRRPDSASLVSDNGVTWSVVNTTMADAARDDFGDFLGISKKTNVYQAGAKRTQTIVFEPERPERPTSVKFKAKVSTFDPDFFQAYQAKVVFFRGYVAVTALPVIDVSLEQIPVPFLPKQRMR